MTPRPSSASGLFDPDLVDRARAGSKIARRRLRRRSRSAVYPLALSLTGRPMSAARAVRLALDDALAATGQDYTGTVVAAVHTRAAALTDGSLDDEGRRSRAALALCDRGGLSQAAAARLLGLTRQQLAASHARGRSDLGVAPAPDRCRGWSLVSRDPAPLSAAEQQARSAHLSHCRACAGGLRSRALVRRRSTLGVLGGAGTVVAFAGNAVLANSAPVIAAGAIGVAVAGGVGLQTVDRALEPGGPVPVPTASMGPAPTLPALSASPDPDVPAVPEVIPTPRGRATPQASPAVQNSPTTPAPRPSPPQEPTPSPEPQQPLPALPVPLPSLPPLPALPVPLPPLPPLPTVRLTSPPLPLPTSPLSFPVTPRD